MQFYISQKSKIAFIVVVLTFVLGILALSGFSSGKKQAQSKVVLGMVFEIEKGLDFFYKDNGRFPSANEFLEEKIMAPYFNQLPALPEIDPKICNAAYIYNRPSIKSYELNFCLPKSTDGFIRGWNKLVK